MEEAVLFAERLYVGTSVSAFSLESHIGIWWLLAAGHFSFKNKLTGDFGYLREVIYNRKEKNEACNAKVSPLDVLKGCLIGANVVEEDI